MMFFIYKLAGSLVVPPGLLILLIIAAAAGAFRRPARRGLGGCLLLLAAVVWFISSAVGSEVILGRLEERYRAEPPANVKNVAVLALCGGNLLDNKGRPVLPGPFAMERVFCAVSFLQERGGVLIPSGGTVFGYEGRSEAGVMAAVARKMGWSGKILLEEKSRTTKENLMYCADLLRKMPAGKGGSLPKEVVLVTSAFHMPRAMKFAARYLPGVKVWPYPCPRTTDPVFRGFSSLLPTAGSLHDSCLGFKERVGLLAAGL